jgi:PBSX family phage terminase large subunit
MFGPTFPMLKNTTLREFFKFCPKEVIYKHNRTDHSIQLINSTEIIYLAGDNEKDIDRARGLTLGAAYLDEVRMSQEYAWEIVLSRLRHQKGSRRAWITTTPKGFDWLYRLFYLKKDKQGNPLKNASDYAIFGGSTLDNPYTPEEYKQTLLDTYVGAFRKQEIYGEFVGYEGLVYPNFRPDTHVLERMPIEFKEVVAGIDFGFTNPMVILVVGFDTDGRAYVIDEFYERKIMVDEEGLIPVLKKYLKKYGIEKVYCDPSEPQYIELMRRHGLPTVAAENDLMPGIAEMSARLEVQKDGRPRLYIGKNCVNTLTEIQQYRYPEGSEGKPVQEKPLKIFDHAMDSLRYVLFSKRVQVKGELAFLDL